MSPDEKYRIPLDELERTAHVDADEQLESVPPAPELPPEDPRGPQPDRDWFHSGG